MIPVKVKRLHPDAVLPTYATDGSACFDIYATHDGVVTEGSSCTFSTGLAFEIPAGYVMEVYSRSGQAFNSDVRLGNAVGIIDSDFRGELKIKLTRDNPFGEYRHDKTKAVAQAMVVPVEKCSFTEVTELSSTARGENGFGSTDNS